MATRNSGMTAVEDVQDDVEKGHVKPTDPAPVVNDLDPNADETSSTTSVPETVDGAEAQLKYLGWHDWWKCVKLVLKPWGLSMFLICIPFAWVSHWKVESWGHEAQFALCFLSIMSLQNIFESCGDQLAWRTGKDLGEFICITFKNCVEATLALILLKGCHLRLLQSTIIGVVVLHLLLVQGTAFFIGGSKTVKQKLHDHQVAINPSLLMVGVLGVVLPTAFFAALDRGDNTTVGESPSTPLVGDAVRGWILKTSHAVSIMLLVVHIWPLPQKVSNRLPQFLKRFLPADTSATTGDPARKKVCRCGCVCLPVVNDPPVSKEDVYLIPIALCAFFIVVSIVVMSVTAEFLVESIDPVRERYHIQSEFFGLILLPLVSFLPEAALAFCSFMPTLQMTTPPEPEARGTPIDSSIQFTLWWMPIVILIGWWIGKPIHLLFDYFEVALLLGTCFLVNYVTADGETNFAEGFTMFTFYAMIATAAWFYPGQSQVGYMLSCPGSVAAAVASGVQNALVFH
ncbi:hypothetical protein ONZ51_g723 [Trametes cubensis]|uniref:Sodium/calcium exchanger membrane region domain-containing protein n=1 Tax=Trametes cubensis TaxID=1111947 RepID=A0AAD7XDP3_9APHY|nr:hypothetical protein ONZ51_g723 [Trametes cubensis]